MLLQVDQIMLQLLNARLTTYTGAFGGLLAYGIQMMGERRGLSGKSCLAPGSDLPIDV
jgi:hypothetical protein